MKPRRLAVFFKRSVQSRARRGDFTNHSSLHLALVSLAALSAMVVGVAFGPTSAQAAGDANQDSCPQSTEESPGFRSYLPDCRAYEQVTPVFKDGFGAFFESFPEAGNSVLISSIGVFAGAESRPSACGNKYNAIRTNTSWHTVPLDAPLNQFDFVGNCRTLLSNDGTALLRLHTLDQSIYASDLYRRAEDGALTKIGPMLPDSALPPLPIGSGEGFEGQELAGASSDLTRILFRLEASNDLLPAGATNGLWPFDTTVKSSGHRMFSLYEYSGVENSEPALVGVDDAGELISQCGTFLGSAAEVPSTNSHNAISANGEVVYFSPIGEDNFACGGEQPPVDEIYARLNGSTTVPISEPSPQSGCASVECIASTGQLANFRDANFEGASTDGAKVFFTSTQQLLDSATQDPNPEDSAALPGKHCTRTEGLNGCNLYEYSLDAPAGHQLVDLSVGDTSGEGPRVQGVAALSDDGSHVYFVARGVLTAGPSAEGREPTAGAENLYVSDTVAGTTDFVATLEEADAEQWAVGPDAPPMNVTSDGRYLVFTSEGQLTADDTTTSSQVFRYDAGTSQLLRVSVGDQGFNNNGNTNSNAATIPRPNFNVPRTPGERSHPAVSDAGAVVFASPAALTPNAFNARCREEEEGFCVARARNTYEYIAGRVFLISDGQDLRSALSGISPDGQNVYFSTAASLVPQDTDTLADIYDARTDGGFAAPVQPPSCEADECQGSQAPPPLGVTPATAQFAGPGNTHARKHRHHRRKKKGGKHHSHKQPRTASHKRGVSR